MQQAVKWDTDKLMRGVLGDDQRAVFVKEVEARCSQMQDTNTWQDALVQSTADTTWRMLRDVITSVAKEHFVQHPLVLRKRPGDTTTALQHQHDCKLHLQSLPIPRRFWSQGADRETASLHAISDLLRRWQALARYWKAQRAAKKYTTRDKRRRVQQRVWQMQTAWNSFDFRTVWQTARILSGRSLGPKKRRFDRPRSCRPTVEQWTQHMSQMGPQGGCQARAVVWEQHVDKHAVGATNWQKRYREDPIWRGQMYNLAGQDMCRVAKQTWYAKTHKAVPTWTVPNELWRMLFYPNYHARQQRTGLGYSAEMLATPNFRSCLQQTLCQVRCSGSAPIEWHCSQGTQIDKQNGKPLCEGIRVINVLCPFGKHVYRTLWNRGRPQSARGYAAGYAKNKSREEAIMQQLCLGHRLRSAGVGHATFYKDIANAFYSPGHPRLDVAIEQTMAEDDKQLLRQRHRAASIHIQAADGNILLETGSGALQGDSFASDLFVEQYHPLLDEWLERLSSDPRHHDFEAYDPINAKYVNVALSTYADDLALKTRCDTATDLQSRAAEVDDALDEVLAFGNMAQNRGKQEVVIHFAGRGSHAQARSVYRGEVELEGKVVPQARYLGEMYVHNGSTTAARKHRLNKAQVAWSSMGAFWTRSGCSRRSVCMVFRSLVFETAVCGLVPFVLHKSDYSAIDSFIVGKGRYLMRGQACKKDPQPDGTVRYRAVPNKVVWQYLGLAGSKIEMCIRRLQYWQRLLRAPHLHSYVFAVIFGHFKFERGPPLQEDGTVSDSAHPWLHQLVDDIEALREVDDLAHVPEQVDRRPLRLFMGDVKHDFLHMDVTMLRRKFLCVSIPPPEYQAERLEAVEADEPDPDLHVCECLLADGTMCGRFFKTARALAQHQTCFRNQGLHGTPSLEAQLVVTNQCLFCREVFANTFATRRHVRAALLSQHCSGRSSITNRQPEIPTRLSCTMCDAQLADLNALHDHLEQHLGARFQ